MKTYFFIFFLLIGFSLQASAQSDPVERTKERAKNKTNNRIDNKVDQKIDEGLDALEGLFKRKKKKSKKEDNNDNESEDNSDQSTETQTNNASEFLEGMLGGKGNTEVKAAYNFNSNFVMHMQTYKKNGKEEGNVSMRYYNSADPNYMAMEVMEVKQEGESQNPQSTIIVDGSQQAMITLMKETKQAVVMKMPNAQDYEQAQEQEQSPDEAMKNFKITRTGRTKNILGYTCYETIIESDEIKAVSWTTKQVKLSQFKAFAGMFIQEKEKKKQVMAIPNEFTMEMESTDKKTGEKTKMTVTEVNENQNTTISTSGYKVMDVSGVIQGNNQN